MAAPKEKEQRFDQVKLQGMHEPITVRVEKMRGNVRQPIELPAKGDQQTGFQPPGVGWSRDEVLNLENFVLTKWAGGGYYEFTVTDAKNERMTWTGVWDPRLYPEKIPPNTAEAAFVGAVPTAPVAGPQQVPPAAQPFGSAAQSGWPGSFAAGYNNPPFSGPTMTPAPPPPPQMPSQAPPMWSGGQGPQGPWSQQGPWGSQQQGPWAGPWSPMGWQGGFGQQYLGPQGFAPGFSGPGTGFGPRSRWDEDRRDRDRRFDRDDEEKKELENRLRAIEMEKKDLEHRQAVERQQQLHEQQMKSLQDEIRRIGEARGKGEDDEVRRLREEAQRAREQQLIEQQVSQRQLMEQQMQMMRDQLTKLSEKPHGETDEYRRLREEQERQRQEFDRQRQEQERRLEVERSERERERERYDRERRDELMQREMKESREATERRFEQLAASQSARASDPLIDALKETARMSGENMRELARTQQAQTDRLSQFMVAPAQLAAIMKDNSSGADGMMRNIVETVGGIGNLYKNAAETIMQMSSGGSEPPAARLIQEGIGRASEIAEKYLAVKRDSVISEGRVKTAQAQTEQTRVAAEAQVRTAAMNVQAAQARGWATPPPVANSGLGGANGSNGAQQAQRPPQAAQQPAAQPANGNGQVRPPKHTGPIDLPVEEDTTRPSGAPPRTSGPTEEEMFGVALESVHRLRRGVAEGKLDPSKTIDAVLQGVEHVVTNQLVIPAFVLFQQERWADFIDIMLPDVPQDFKTECVRILIEEVEVDAGGGGDDDAGTALVPGAS